MSTSKMIKVRQVDKVLVKAPLGGLPSSSSSPLLPRPELYLPYIETNGEELLKIYRALLHAWSYRIWRTEDAGRTPGFGDLITEGSLAHWIERNIPEGSIRMETVRGTEDIVFRNKMTIPTYVLRFFDLVAAYVYKLATLNSNMSGGAWGATRSGMRVFKYLMRLDAGLEHWNVIKEDERPVFVAMHGSMLGQEFCENWAGA